MIASVEPKGPKTGYQHQKCYANGDHNCSTKITGEHFISQGLLKQIELNKTAKISGLRWQEPNTFNIVPLKSLASNILCDRHNSALSALDAAITNLSDAIRRCDSAFKPSNGKIELVDEVMCGEDIERWFLKSVIGAVCSGSMSPAFLKSECLDVLYGRVPWPEGWGLYVENLSGSTVYHSDSFLFEIRFNPETLVVLAFVVIVRGLTFTLVLGRPDNPDSFGLFRPDALVFRKGIHKSTIELTWQRPFVGRAMYFDRVGTYDGPPPNWEKWEQDG
jgi:hypothetical protein